jgi:hypothetical protein
MTIHAILYAIKDKRAFDVAICCAFDVKQAIICLFNRLYYRSPASRSFQVQRAVELAFVDAIGVKLPFESSEPWCMPSKSREPSTFPSAVPSTSSEPSSTCSIGYTIRVQRAVELVVVHAIRGKYTAVHAILCAIKVNRAFDVTICYCAFKVNGAIGCSIGYASQSEPLKLPSSTKSDSSQPSSRLSYVPSELSKPPTFPCALPLKKSEPSYVPSAVPSESNVL